MKKTFLILSLGLLALGSCKNKPGRQNSVVGKWKPVAMDLKGMTEEEKKEMMTNVVLEFLEAGTFTATTKDNKQEGTYIFNEKDHSLAVTNSKETGESKTQKFTIGWEGDLLLMTNEEGTVKLKKE